MAARRPVIGSSHIGNAPHNWSRTRPASFTTCAEVNTRRSSMTTAVPNGAKSSSDLWSAATHSTPAGAEPAIASSVHLLVAGCGFQVISTSKFPSVAALATNQFAVPLTLIPNFSLT